jgi:hypothetical protein
VDLLLDFSIFENGPIVHFWWLMDEPFSGRHHTKGEGVVCLQGAYHGNTEQLIKIAPYKPKPGIFRSKVDGFVPPTQQS